MLFINADRDYVTGRNQNELGPEHAEKIVSVYHAWRKVPGYSRLVHRDELLAEGANLNIRRWVDNSPPPEPQDVRAHLYGGVPKAEVAGKAELFGAFGVNAAELFTAREGEEDYYDFLPEGPEATAARIPGLAEARERELRKAYEKWWAANAEAFAELADDRQLMRLRKRLVGSFTEAVGGLGVLDEYATAGIVADWWTANRNDLKALAAGGFDRVLEGWVQSVESMVDPVAPGGAKASVTAGDWRRAMDQPVVRELVPEFLAEVARADEAHAKADADYKAAVEARDAAKGGGDEEEGDEERPRDPVPPEELAKLEREVARTKKERAAATKKRRDLNARFLKDLRAATEVAFASGDTERIVLELLNRDLAARRDTAVAAVRRELVETFRRWVDKYGVSLAELEEESKAAAEDLEKWLERLGYAR